MKQGWMALAMMAALLVIGCGGHGVVESGTYTGVVTKVVPDKLEIYVQLDDGPEIELYFKEFTTLTQGDTEVAFDVLAADQRIEVEVRKVGKRMDPVSVEILP